MGVHQTVWMIDELSTFLMAIIRQTEPFQFSIIYFQNISISIFKSVETDEIIVSTLVISLALADIKFCGKFNPNIATKTIWDLFNTKDDCASDLDKINFMLSCIQIRLHWF